MNPADIVYTPPRIAKDIVTHFKPSGKCLDPCKGDGVFLKLLPPGSDWCEIREGKDFFKYKEKVDWIIGNPPYSIFVEWLRHSFDIADNVVYIVPTNKIFQSFKIMDQIKKYGGIHTIIVYGSGNGCGFPFGFSVGAFYFKSPPARGAWIETGVSIFILVLTILMCRYGQWKRAVFYLLELMLQGLTMRGLM